MKNLEQMELIKLTSLQEDTLANLSPLQVTKKVSKIRDTSGQSILDLSKSVDRLGSLEKTLVDTLNSVSTPYSRTWRVKVTPQGRLVFQLLASVPTTKEKESGLWLTPSATQISERSPESMEKRKKWRASTGRTTVPPGNLSEQVQYGSPTTDMMRLWPTPTTDSATERTKKYAQGGTPLTMAVQTWPTPAARDWKDTGENTNYEKIAKKGKLAGAVKMWPTPTTQEIEHPNMQLTKTGRRLTKDGKNSHSLNLADRVKMWPTPNASDNRDRGNLSDPAIQRRIAMGKQVGLTMAVKEKKGGGTLNPTWVEWLMGYPSGWTDLSPSEIASSLKSPTTSDNQSFNQKKEK